jgi:hypothetical protein
VLREDALDPLELQPEPGEPETEEEELSIEVDDDSEVLENTAPSRRLALEDLRPRGAASGQSREGTWPPAAPAPFGTVEEEDVEEISLDAADPEPTPDPPSRSRSPLSEPARAVAELRATPAPPDAPQVIAATVPVSVELRPGSPAHASVSIPVQVMVGGRLTQVQLNLRLVLDLKLQK